MQAMPPNQFRDGECRAGTRNLIVRACAAVVLAGFLVSGLGTGVEDAAAGVKKLRQQADMAFGSAAGDADLAGTVVESTGGAKTVTGGATDFGGQDRAAEFTASTTVAQARTIRLRVMPCMHRPEIGLGRWAMLTKHLDPVKGGRSHTPSEPRNPTNVR